ncbi:MAG TPA: helix-turn-helix domain-containing protein [Actinophytocola sp.]|uniref:helix-turn-helix domain-containing protein n=1 Tax=Actinophytocola sp. TaxID=1872138 RepID=UPI002DB732E5|nr:helix-turn-helix domain-containing protein [Actinophytocola sp.]HEU5473715.1 helix-turn-helix domain-containing protein [Actinophytocola sp.]
MLASLIQRSGYGRNRQAVLDAVGVTAAALSQYVRGQTRPSFQRLLALAEFFGVSLDYLVYGEPLAAPADHGSVAKYVERAIVNVQARASRQSDLLTRIGRVLADRVNEVARELAESETVGREGLIQQDEVLRVERYCRQVDIVSTDLSPNVIDIEDGDVVAGRFLQVVAANLAKGCKYRFLLAGIQSEAVVAFRDLLAKGIGGDHLHENCAFRWLTIPVMTGSGLYRLDAGFVLEEPGLYTQFNKYLRDGVWLGYLNSPNDDSNADMLMSPAQNAQACEAFEVLWSMGRSNTIGN